MNKKALSGILWFFIFLIIFIIALFIGIGFLTWKYI